MSLKKSLCPLCIFYIVFFPSPAFSEPSTGTAVQREGGDVLERTSGFEEDINNLSSYVLHPDKAGMVKLLSLGAGTAFLMFIDEDVRHEVKKRSGSTLDAMEGIFEPLGRWEVQGIIGGCALGTGYLMRDRKLIDASLTGLEAYLITGGVVELIKFISGRERPYEEKGNGAFFKGGLSFPSGHSARSFAWAAVFSEYYHDNKIVPLLSYGVATMIAVARLESDRHWASDVFFGSCLGFAIGKGLSHLHMRDKDITLSPYITEEIAGISSSFKF